MVNNIRQIVARISRLLDDAAFFLITAAGMFRPPRKVRLVEQPNGAFLLDASGRRSKSGQPGQALRITDGRLAEPTAARARSMLAGAQVEIILQASRFIFRPLELPRRAAEFLEGIVRAQIDRLTPWKPADAVFGWSEPASVANDRIEVMVAATARETLQPTMQAFGELRADSIKLATVAEGIGATSVLIQVLATKAGGAQRARRVKHWLLAILFLTLFVFVAAVAASIVIGGRLDGEKEDLARRIADRRAALLSGRGSAADQALLALASKKRATPSSVIVIEALSQTLPDDTYLTELHIEHGQLQIAGLTRDAPALIRLIEQSQHFSRATFFAPTTRTANENGERFHIQAQIEPVFPTPQ